MRESLNRELNMRRVQEFMSYYESYYGSDFRPNQGLDEITDMIAMYSVQGSWIDLGGGTSTFIWLPAFTDVTEVFSVDIYAETAYVQDKARSMKPSGCYDHVINRYSKSIEEMNEICITYSQMDLFSDFAINRSYDNVSQFGLLGLCRTKQEYLRQLAKLSELMNRESVFMGANWVFSSTYAEKYGYNNSYLNTALITEFIQSRKGKLQYSERITIYDDPCYEAVLIYAFRLD